MAYDGIAVSNIVYELKSKFTGGRIDKIYQPGNDEIIFSVRSIKREISEFCCRQILCTLEYT